MKSRIVFVLHSSDELKLIGLQNKIKEEYKKNNGNEILLRLFPLWSEPVSSEVVEAVKDKRLSKVTVLAPLCNEGFVYCPLCFSFLKNDGTCGFYETRINLLKGNIKSDCSDFGFSPRVFRLAEKHQEENRYWLTDSLWQKLKKIEG